MRLVDMESREGKRDLYLWIATWVPLGLLSVVLSVFWRYFGYLAIVGMFLGLIIVVSRTRRRDKR
jgi:hypothetical protein